MQVLILEQDPDYQSRVATALLGKGFQVICVESHGQAEAFLRLEVVDVLVLGERVHGRLSHSLALLAECRNPDLATILLTDRSGPDVNELFELIPAIYSILGRATAPAMVAQIAVAAVSARAGGQGRAQAPGAARAAAAAPATRGAREAATVQAADAVAPARPPSARSVAPVTPAPLTPAAASPAPASPVQVSPTPVSPADALWAEAVLSGTGSVLSPVIADLAPSRAARLAPAEIARLPPVPAGRRLHLG